MPRGIAADEAYILLPCGEYFVFPSAQTNPKGADYVRFVNQKGQETVYWHVDEWETSGEEVMGAICGAMLAGSGCISARTSQNE